MSINSSNGWTRGYVPGRRRHKPRRTFGVLLAIVEGVGIHLLGNHYSPDTATGALDAQLSVIFGPDGDGRPAVAEQRDTT